MPFKKATKGLWNEATCLGKRKFTSWGEAQRYNKYIQKKTRVLLHGKRYEHLEPYRCGSCSMFHLGHRFKERSRHQLDSRRTDVE